MDPLSWLRYEIESKQARLLAEAERERLAAAVRAAQAASAPAEAQRARPRRTGRLARLLGWSASRA